MDKAFYMKQLVVELNKYAHDYYVEDNPSISDAEYDVKYDELLKLEKELEPLSYSPTQRVGGTILDKFQKHKHLSKLWSLDKAQTIEELEAFIKKVNKSISEYNESNEDKLPEAKYISTKKFDGLTVNCTYDNNGLLIKSASRGNGQIGEDISLQAKTIKSLPLKIDNDFLFEVHGEAIMTKNAFEKYNKKAEVPLKNLRNGAAGALRNLNISETARRNLSAYFYDVGHSKGRNFKNYTEMLNFLVEKGFPVDDYIGSCYDIEDMKKEIEHIEGIRDDLQYDIDGIVFAVDDIKTRELMGYTVKAPRWAIAYKFEALETMSTLLDVEWNVGRSGRVNPTAILEPVELGGVVVKRATLNNMDDIKKKNIKIGSTVQIRRSNDVIPEILGIVGKNNNEIEIVPPINCPYCNVKLEYDGVHYFCKNSLDCAPQLVKSIVHFASNDGMNIEGFSNKTAFQLYDELGIKSIEDLYKLEYDKLINLDRFGEKKVRKLLDEIEGSKKPSLANFIYALGIPNVGKKTSVDIANRYKSLDLIKNSTFEELIEIKDIGDIVAGDIVSFFSSERILSIIEDLISQGIDPVYEEAEILESEFSNKTVVVTGTFTKYSRKEITNFLESLGARVSSSVSKNTYVLIYGEDAGLKYEKAIKNGIKILNEDEFYEIVGNIV